MNLVAGINYWINNFAENGKKEVRSLLQLWEGSDEMSSGSIVKNIGFVVALITLIGAFSLFYSDTHELISSLTAAVLSACLVLVSFLGISWLVQVFTK